MEIILNPDHSVVMNIKWKIKCLEHYPENSEGSGNILATVAIAICALLVITVIVGGT